MSFEMDRGLALIEPMETFTDDLDVFVHCYITQDRDFGWHLGRIEKYLTEGDTRPNHGK